MKTLDSAMDSLNSSDIEEIYDIYEIWSWHPGMG